MKKHALTVFLLTLFFNIVISYFIGVKYKVALESLLSSAIYYQVVVFISLTMPLIISAAYGFFIKVLVIWKLSRFKKKKIDVTRLDDETKEMYRAIVEQDIPTKAQVKDMYQALNEQFKS